MDPMAFDWIPPDQLNPFAFNPPNFQANAAAALGWDSLLTVPPIPDIPDAAVEETIRGEQAKVQIFYEGPATCKCCKNWVEKAPNKIPDEAREKYDEAAIKVYKSNSHSDETVGGIKQVKSTLIEIQSSIIRRTTQPLLHKVGFPKGEKGEWAFRAPFEELFFVNSDLINLRNTYEQDSEERHHLQLLVDVCEELFRDIIPEVTDLHANKLTSCVYLWTIFPKGMLVYRSLGGQDFVSEVVSTAQTLRGWYIKCRTVRFTGRKFGLHTETIFIRQFHGYRAINELAVYPLSFYEDAGKLKERLAKRALKVLDCQDPCYQEYDGTALGFPDEDDDGDSNPLTKNYVEGRVMMDAYGHAKFEPWSTPSISPLERPDLKSDIVEEESTTSEANESEGRPSDREQQDNRDLMLKERRWLILMYPFLPGFSFKNQTWYQFAVEKLQPIQWNDVAFDNLIIDQKCKELVFNFVEAHDRIKDIDVDWIRGKGQGLVLLLSGLPGTGKTLTVEAVADKCRRPFYQVQAADLGTSPSVVRERLSQAFNLCAEWGAIFLIDEADAFIKSRTHSERQSDLCCVMLGSLEYYRGVMFMTTNIPDNVDDAVLSRVDIHLTFPTLEFRARRQIWSNFLVSSTQFSKKQSRISDVELDELAGLPLSGREIKNSFKNACKWCYIKESDITLSDLMTAVQITAPTAASRANKELGMDMTRSQKRMRVED